MADAKIHVLRVPIDNVTESEAVDRLLTFLEEDRHHLLVTPNPEMIMLAQDDPSFMEILRAADLSLPDGVGVVLASRFIGRPFRERVPGCDVIQILLEKMAHTDHTVYFFGAAPGVAAQAKENMEKKYPGIRIIGVHDGYFDQEEEKLICEEIRQKRPDLLMLGLSMGMAEKWAYAHSDLPVRVSACVGGTIDVLAGQVKRAPALMRKMGVEWLYRLIRQPWRAVRMLRLPVFVLKVLFQKTRGS
ncbi:MAG: WecB/TagA/CpsF family glycosyltransferase [Clostridiales bacterium]|jgi:N-acetylglucosaminyldiphosphoundecaprenol N-acetyl-beta-D-mannosaminyltransferase|nr:WecB/TagA/CpsF family glycosyltransferase [Clostridiales bacterium]